MQRGGAEIVLPHAAAMPLLADAAPPLLLVVGDADRLTASDASLKSLLQRLTNASVTVVGDAALGIPPAAASRSIVARA